MTNSTQAQQLTGEIKMHPAIEYRNKLGNIVLREEQRQLRAALWRAKDQLKEHPEYAEARVFDRAGVLAETIKQEK